MGKTLKLCSKLSDLDSRRSAYCIENSLHRSPWDIAQDVTTDYQILFWSFLVLILRSNRGPKYCLHILNMGCVCEMKN